VAVVVLKAITRTTTTNLSIHLASINSKSEPSIEVKIIQRWDGVRSSIKPLLFDFYIYLQDLKLKENTEALPPRKRILSILEIQQRLEIDKSSWPHTKAFLAMEIKKME